MSLLTSESKTRIIGALLIVAGLSGCAVNDPYSRDRSPVEVRRGEDRPVYPGKPAPDESRPVYYPEDGFPENQDDIYAEDEAQQTYEDELPKSVPAVERLIAQAENGIAKEEYTAAVASAENALRLDPQSVSAYHTLAKAYLYQNRYDESEQMALRALSILRGKGPNVGKDMSRDLWLLIAQTRRERGDDQGAERAMQQAGGRF